MYIRKLKITFTKYIMRMLVEFNIVISIVIKCSLGVYYSWLKVFII